MYRAPRALAFISLIAALLCAPSFAYAEEAAPAAAPTAAPAPAVAAPTTPTAPTAEAPKVETPAVPAAPVADAPKAEAPAVMAVPSAEAPKEKAAKPVDEKRIGKMRERWRKMTPEKRDEIRKKADRRLNERYERLKPAEQTQVNNVVSDIEKLSKEQRSIVLAKVRQKAFKDNQQRKMMRDLDKATKKQGKSESIEPAPLAEPAAH